MFKKTTKENNTTVYSDSSYASIKFDEKDTSIYKYGRKFESTNMNYSTVYITPDDSLHNYLVKQKEITAGWTDKEKNTKTIYIELKQLDKLNQPGLHFEHICDHISFTTDHYVATTYGCCGAEAQIELFDYKSNSIIKGNGKIITANAPNSKIQFYLAFENTYSDSTQLGILHIAYNAQKKYDVRIKLNTKICEPFSPQITIETKNPKDKSNSDNEYTLWSFEKIKSSNEISNIVIKMIFYCEPSEKIIKIPIINGRPFGKEEKDQEYKM